MSLQISNPGQFYPQRIPSNFEELEDAVQQWYMGKFRGHLEKGRNPEEVLTVAQLAIQSSMGEAHEVGLYLFRALVDKGYGYPEALKAACIGIEDSCNEVQSAALKILEALVEKKFGCKGIAQLASAKIKAADETVGYFGWSNLEIALELYSFLVKAGQYIHQAEVAVSDAIRNENQRVRISALRVTSALVEKGSSLEKARTVAFSVLQDENQSVRGFAHRVIVGLVERNCFLGEAEIAAFSALKNKDQFARSSALDVIRALVEKNQCLQKAETVAFAYIRSKEAYKILRALMGQGKCLEQGLSLALEMINDSPREKVALQFFEALIKRDETQVQVKLEIDTLISRIPNSRARQSLLELIGSYETGEALISKNLFRTVTDYSPIVQGWHRV